MRDFLKALGIALIYAASTVIINAVYLVLRVALGTVAAVLTLRLLGLA